MRGFYGRAEEMRSHPSPHSFPPPKSDKVEPLHEPSGSSAGVSPRVAELAGETAGETAAPLFRRKGSSSQCLRKKTKVAFHEPRFACDVPRQSLSNRL